MAGAWARGQCPEKEQKCNILTLPFANKQHRETNTESERQQTERHVCEQLILGNNWSSASSLFVFSL